jgi:UDP-glucuronate 4-epimerase
MSKDQSSTARTILITGATGTVGLPIARGLAVDNEVIAVARFSDPAARSALETSGVHCVTCDLSTGDLGDVPSDVDHVVNFARPADPGFDFDLAMAGHAEAIGMLLSHCRGARSVLHCSSTSMYARRGVPAKETDPITDDRHPARPTYTIGKIGAEAVVRAFARTHGVPTTIARLNVPYGDHGGWPANHLRTILTGQPVVVHPNAPNRYNPIHTDDILRTVPPLLACATVPATIINWAGSEQVSIEDWVEHLAGLVGRSAHTITSADATESVTVDTSRLEALAGPTTVPWRDGMRRMARALHPDLVS